MEEPQQSSPGVAGCFGSQAGKAKAQRLPTRWQGCSCPSCRPWPSRESRRRVDSFRHAAARPRDSDTDDWQGAAERAQPRGLPGFDDGIALDELGARLPDEAERRSSSACPTRRRHS